MAETRCILVVEDDPVVAMLSLDWLHQLGFAAIGPAASVNGALRLMEATPTLNAALLDCNLGREMVWSVADRLIERRLPFVFATGYGQDHIPPRFAHVPVLTKPYTFERLRAAVSPMLLGD
jgi:CheY-like chemotaxis protein